MLYSLNRAQLFCNPADCSPPGSSVHGILQARILEEVTIFFSRGSSRPRHWTQVSWTAGGFFTTEPQGSPSQEGDKGITVTANPKTSSAEAWCVTSPDWRTGSLGKEVTGKKINLITYLVYEEIWRELLTDIQHREPTGIKEHSENDTRIRTV